MDPGKVETVLRILLDRNAIDSSTLCRFCAAFHGFDAFLEEALEWQGDDPFALGEFDEFTNRKWHWKVVRKLAESGHCAAAVGQLDDTCDAETYNLAIVGLCWEKSYYIEKEIHIRLVNIIERMKRLKHKCKIDVFDKAICTCYSDKVKYDLFMQMKEECPTEVASQGCYTRVLAACDDLDKVLQVLKETRAKGVQMEMSAVGTAVARIIDRMTEEKFSFHCSAAVEVIKNAGNPDQTLADTITSLQEMNNGYHYRFQFCDVVTRTIPGAYPKTCAVLFKRGAVDIVKMPSVVSSLFLLAKGSLPPKTCENIVTSLKSAGFMKEAASFGKVFRPEGVSEK